MNKNELARRLARKSHRSHAQAADYVDTLVYNLLKTLKRPAPEPEPAEQKSSFAAVAPPKAKP
jgi:hypothetical protein